MGRVSKLLKRVFAHEKFLKIHFKFKKSENKGTFFGK